MEGTEKPKAGCSYPDFGNGVGFGGGGGGGGERKDQRSPPRTGRFGKSREAKAMTRAGFGSGNTLDGQSM
jgi:hypothetical protein